MTEAQQPAAPLVLSEKPAEEPQRGDSAAVGAASPPGHGQHAAAQQQHAPPAEAASNGAADAQESQQQAVDLVDPREAAISMLRGIGVSSEQAAEAVEQTRDVFVGSDPAAWADAAQVWLAEELEHSAERDKLAEAMAASLAEEQDRRQTAAPLADRPEAELRQRFARSMLLPQFQDTAFRGVLFAPALRAQLVALLELERQYRCLWYPGPGTDQYFAEVAHDCVAAAELPKGRVKRKSAKAAEADAAHAGSKRRALVDRAATSAAAAALQRQAAATGSDAAAGNGVADAPAAAAAADPGPAAAAAWANCLAAKALLLREQLAPADWLPAAPGELPPFLVPYAQRAAAAAAAEEAEGGNADDGEVVITN